MDKLLASWGDLEQWQREAVLVALRQASLERHQRAHTAFGQGCDYFGDLISQEAQGFRVAHDLLNEAGAT